MTRPLAIEQWDNLAEAARYRADELARRRRISTRQLRREFHRVFGLSPKEWLDQRRTLKAERLLLNGDSVKSVALELGFKQSSHFCRHFKLMKRMTPSEFVAQKFRFQFPLKITPRAGPAP